MMALPGALRNINFQPGFAGDSSSGARVAETPPALCAARTGAIGTPEVWMVVSMPAVQIGILAITAYTLARFW